MDKDLQVGFHPFMQFITTFFQGKEEGHKLKIVVWCSSKKVSQLISEFREQDSYINSDYDSDSDSGTSCSGAAGPSKSTWSTLTNSIIASAESLLSVAKHAERIPGAPTPRVTMRLSRIEEFPGGGHEDERIVLTFEAVRKMGVELVFGDLSEVELADLHRKDEERRLKPSKRINLDPTSLMGLCADVLHHPLPADADGARARFYRPRGALTNGKTGSYPIDGEEEGHGQSQNSRELLKSLLEEMEVPLIEEMRDTLADFGGEVEFWATKEAVRYLTEAFGSEEVIGDGSEQRRMRRLIGLEEGDFFEGSRYEGTEGCLTGLKVKIFDDNRPTEGRSPSCEEGMCSFQLAVSRICSQFLSEYHARPDSPSLPSLLQARKMSTPKISTFRLPFTVVSLHCLERGAAEGMTTLTMGNVVFRELFSTARWKVKGWCHSNDELGGERAAVWMLPYRCLGEGKRVKFERGDYSYPGDTGGWRRR